MQRALLPPISLIMIVSFLVSAPVAEKEGDTHSLQKEKSARNKENNGISIPSQGVPPSLTLNDGPTYNFNANTNLDSLLADIRKHISSKEYKIAHSMAQAALQSIQQTEQNKFYLNQIRKEETKIYYEQAKLAMSQEKYSLASQLLEKYRENVAKDLSERKIQREVVPSKDGPKDATLFGKLDRQTPLEDYLMIARVQFINGDLTGATETYRAVENRFPDNLEAKNILKHISMMQQQGSYLGYRKTRQKILEEIDREWERPKVFDRQIEHLQEARNKSSEIEDKPSLIKIPEVSFFKSPLDEAMQELMLKSKWVDLTEQDPAKKGIPIIVMKPSDGDSFPLVTITLKNMELGKMIQWITEMVNWTYDIKAEAVVISKSGGSFKGRATLETKFFEVTQGTINRMTGGAGGADDPGQKIKAFLEGAGISFDDGKGHKFVFDGFQMIVTHDRRSLALIERILAKLDAVKTK